jgi:hypothetical protein
MAGITGTNGAGSGLPAPSGFGVFGDSDVGPGVVAFSHDGVGLVVKSVDGPAAQFVSDTGDGLSSSVGAPNATAVFGGGSDQTGVGVSGEGKWGVAGNSFEGVGVSGEGDKAGVHGTCFGDWGAGVYGEVPTGNNGYAIWGLSNTSYAGLFEGKVLIGGKVYIYGSLSKPGGSFRIDHPLDPGNKYLSHSIVESPDMLNLYNGMIQLDEHGAATVELPEWFDALNHEFRYQLTPIGSPAPNLHIASEIERRSFRIAGGAPRGKVSWQVTGIRQDKWANANRIIVEEEKSGRDRGRYLHPELFGESEEKKVMPGPRPSMPHRPEERPVRRRARSRS